ncbi:predicted protein [Plenodomus lingam JN3]|uniref:Predicted protein n=1 Tax=Leptosphaeria maculans (strain JN3 / isolate v23.1.3 / race Av1-4-5-6-7-8) TaxID=985895 RepID=E5A2S6_LEPMJ|nr:predicted protein [Plenodomus lingam JN3]CBX97872.1 predicted protein [Plenodomus lingam JN3]
MDHDFGGQWGQEGSTGRYREHVQRLRAAAELLILTQIEHINLLEVCENEIASKDIDRDFVYMPATTHSIQIGNANGSIALFETLDMANFTMPRSITRLESPSDCCLTSVAKKKPIKLLNWNSKNKRKPLRHHIASLIAGNYRAQKSWDKYKVPLRGFPV